MPEDVVPEVVDVWPCCWASIVAFDAMGTQWRVGFAGATGLDYCALPPEAGYGTELFEDIRIMEIEALTAMGERRG